MKKIVAFTAFLTLLLTAAHAQEVRFGFQLSPAFSWMSSNTNQINSSGTNLGLKLGMVGEFYFQENYAVTSGLGFFFNTGGTLLHERAGMFWNESDLPDVCQTLDPQGKLKYNLQYVEIPIGLKMRTREFGYIRYFFEPHLGLGFNTQANGDITSEGEQCKDINIQKDVNLLNLFWGLNGGIEYSVSESTSLVGGIGMQFGFADVTDDNGDKVFLDNNPNTPADEKSKGVIRAFIIRLGVIF
ncbi:MAG: outer membrane beta-barrel protein [Phaeodactylibacter sp.]|nr:outer membrane beta-barrel protein [Phaeodactylibacter sp.]MCB9294867.1 outer membrane beta-barrel protein [Lewinellaceae bacterium]